MGGRREGGREREGEGRGQKEGKTGEKEGEGKTVTGEIRKVERKRREEAERMWR